MMKIQQITISNFRGVKDITLTPQHMNFFVGPCGSGKSSILKAIRFGITGKVNSEDIRNNEKTAKVCLTFEDGSTLERCRGTQTTIKVNGKKANAKSANEFLEKILEAPLEYYDSMFGVDYFETLSQRDLTAFLSSILPIKITFAKFCEQIEAMRKMPLKGEEIVYLKSQFPEQAEFGIKEIEAAYKYFFEERKNIKNQLATYETLASFDDSTLPNETKEELENSFKAITEKEILQANYKKDLLLYENSFKAAENAKNTLNKLKEQLKQYDAVTKPDEAVLIEAHDHKKQFEDAISKSKDIIATAKSNIDLFKRTLSSINSLSCPISPKLICTSDKSGIRKEMNELLAHNEIVLKERVDFIARCQREIDKRNLIIEEYNKNTVAYAQKSGLMKQIDEFVIPAVLPKPNAVKEKDYLLEKREINKKLQVFAAYENAQKYLKLKEEYRKKLELAVFAIEVLEPKKGIGAYILNMVLGKYEEICNRKAESIRNGLKIKFDYSDGINIQVCTKAENGFVTLSCLSTGEYLIAIYLLMTIINQIMSTKILVIDSLDKLDAKYTKAFLELLEQDQNFEYVFVGAVDHEDTKNIVHGKNVTYL